MNKILQDDRNFRLEVTEWQGKPAVKKSAKPTTEPKRRERLANEIYGHQFFANLANEHDLNLHVPGIYETGEDYFIREYITAEPVASDDMAATNAEPRLATLTSLLADIDRIEPTGEAKFVGSSDYKDIWKNIDEWTEEPLKTGFLDPRKLGQAKSLARDLNQYTEPRIAHGDMSAFKHSFIMPEGKICFIDFEIFTPQAARYYDVAWGFTRLYALSHDQALAAIWLRTFLENAEKAGRQTEQLLAVILQRTIGLQHDAVSDAKQGTDYRPRAKKLLDLVLKADIDLLAND